MSLVIMLLHKPKSILETNKISFARNKQYDLANSVQALTNSAQDV